MYSFYYDFGLVKLSQCFQPQLCYMDTDSFIFKFTISHKSLNGRISIYDLIRTYALDQFDTSDYGEKNIYNIPAVNKKIPGLMKDELNGSILTHFIGLRAKVYDYKVFGIDANPKVKGVSCSVVQLLNELHFRIFLIVCLKVNKKCLIFTLFKVKIMKHFL